MRSTFTRDISENLLKELKEGAFKPFVDFARKKGDLALCFRGNGKKEAVTIYRNNHIMWNLTFNGRKPEVSISLDHARFMSDWASRIVPSFLEMGFIKKSKDNGCLAVRSKDNEYHAIEIVYRPGEDSKKDEDVVKKSYELLVEMQKSYFSKVKRQINYIKKYYFDTNADAKIMDENHSFYAKPQPCTEKHAQQELFMMNHTQKNGLFIYDLEFMQPEIKEISLKNANKPDMFGIRYNSDGKPTAICLIEVKSTVSALSGKCGLEEHLKGMEQYLKLHYRSADGNKKLIDDRKKEAYRILKQYEEIGFYDVHLKESEEDFLKLNVEIMFIFTNGIHMNKKNLQKNLTVRQALNDYEEYSLVKYGEECKHVDALKKEYT